MSHSDPFQQNPAFEPAWKDYREGKLFLTSQCRETLGYYGRFGWMFDGFEMGLFPLVARPALMELMGPEASKTIGTWFSVIIAMFLVAPPVAGYFRLPATA
jgi:hypothetical protein